MMTIEFKGSHFERDVILWGVRWYVAYPLSYRQIEEMMQGRGVEVDHSTLHRWVLRYVPLLEKAFLARKRPVGSSWRMDETYMRIKGVWKYLYRAVDKAGATIDFLLTANRDRKAALRFLYKAYGRHGVPQKITIDKSGANTAAIDSYKTQHDADIETHQPKYLNNIVEQDHRAIKRVLSQTLRLIRRLYGGRHAVGGVGRWRLTSRAVTSSGISSCGVCAGMRPIRSATASSRR